MRSFLSERLGRGGETTVVNVVPLIDILLFLLIFFVVTSSFVRETGVQVDKPAAVSAGALDAQSVMLALTQDGRIFAGGEEVGLYAVRGLVREELSRQPGRPVVIVADGQSRNAQLLALLDECKLAGATQISLAARISEQ